MNDEEFDKICQDKNLAQTLEQYENNMKNNIKIHPIPNQDVLSLNADQMAEILNKIGFTKAQIDEHSPAIRDALSNAGRVRIMIDDVVEASLGVKGDEVFISSRTNGFGIYNINTGLANIDGMQ